MKPHYHHDFIGVLITSIEVMLIFQAFRVLGGRLASSDRKSIAVVGNGIGAAFTFGGHP